MLAAPIATIQPFVSSRSRARSPTRSKNSPSPAGTPNSCGAWPMMIVSPRPNRKPPITGLETKSDRLPSLSSPPAASTSAATMARAADSAANFAASPSASGPTAEADIAEVAVVALTTSVRDVPRNA
jgi:hypothetical protein